MINICKLYNDLLSYFLGEADREALEPKIKEALEMLKTEGEEEKKAAEEWYQEQMKTVKEKEKEINERCKEYRGCNRDCGNCPLEWESEDLSKDYPDEITQSVYLHFKTPRTTERERQRQEQYLLDCENGAYDD